MKILCTLLLMFSASLALGGEGTVIGARQDMAKYTVFNKDQFKQVLREAARGSQFIKVESHDLEVKAYSFVAQKIRVTDSHGNEFILVPSAPQ